MMHLGTKSSNSKTSNRIDQAVSDVAMVYGLAAVQEFKQVLNSLQILILMLTIRRMEIIKIFS